MSFLVHVRKINYQHGPCCYLLNSKYYSPAPIDFRQRREEAYARATYTLSGYGQLVRYDSRPRKYGLADFEGTNSSISTRTSANSWLTATLIHLHAVYMLSGSRADTN